jgi:hypothetical protein
MCVIRGRPPPPPSRYAGPLGSSGPGTGRTSSRRSGISQAFSILAEADPRGRYGTEPGGPGPARNHIVKAVDQPHELAPSAPDPARNRYMELAPAPTRSATVLLMQPVASPEHLQASAVDHHVNRPIRLLQGGRDTQAGAAAREGRMIRHREIEAAQVQDRPQQALDLTPRPTESQPQHQPRFDRDIRIALRSAPPTGRRRCPRGDRLGRHPDRQAAAPPQRRIVLGPVPNFVPSLRDLVTTRFIGLVRHQRSRGQRATSILVRPPPRQPLRPFLHQGLHTGQNYKN